MVRTRNANKAEKDEGKTEQTNEHPIEKEHTRESPVETPEKKNEPSEETNDEAAPKANDRMARFKALQARAVSDSQLTLAD